MSDTITQLNIFRFGEFWRINSRNTYSQNCYGGIMTIIFFIFVGILSVLKLRQVFMMQNLTAKSSSYCDIRTTTVSTFMERTDQKDITILPFMIGVKIDNDDRGIDYQQNIFNMDKINITIKYGQVFPNNQQYVGWQKCTLNHFPYTRIDDFQTDFNISKPSKQRQNYEKQVRDANQILSKWVCLPLNQSYQLGKRDRNGLMNQLQILIKVCDNGTDNCSTESSSNSSKVIFKILNYDTFPTNSTESARPYIYSKVVTLESNALNTLNLEIDEVTFSTDVSILPYSVIQTKRTFKLSKHYDNFRIPYLSKFAGVSLQIKYSKLNEIHERKYFSLADAFSFIGGIFTFLFGILSTFCMSFRDFNYQAQVAAYFPDQKKNSNKNKEELNKSEGTFKNYLLYIYLSIIGNFCKLTQYKKQFEYKKKAQQLLDVVSLLRRIKLLEKSMLLVFEKNELKGFELANSINDKKQDETYMNIQFQRQLQKFQAVKNANTKKENEIILITNSDKKTQNQGKRKIKNQKTQKSFQNYIQEISNEPVNKQQQVQAQPIPTQKSLPKKINRKLSLPQKSKQIINFQQEMIPGSEDRINIFGETIQNVIRPQNFVPYGQEDEEVSLIYEWKECQGLQRYKDLLKWANSPKKDGASKVMAKKVATTIDKKIRYRQKKPYYSDPQNQN